MTHSCYRKCTKCLALRSVFTCLSSKLNFEMLRQNAFIITTEYSVSLKVLYRHDESHDVLTLNSEKWIFSVSDSDDS